MWSLHLVLALVSGALIAAGATAPDLFYGLMQEDAWAEWATFLAFSAAAALAVRLLLRAETGMERLAALALGLFSLFVAGEEISWGHRVLAFEPPEVFLEHNYQQELNLHNLLKSVLDTRWMVTIIAVAYGAALPGLVRLQALRRFSPLAPSRAFSPWFLLVAGLEIFYPFELTGELAELLLGLVFVADIGERSRSGTALPAVGVAPLVQLGCLLVALPLTPLLEAAIYGDQPANVAKVRAELETLRADLTVSGAVRKKLRRKRRVHKRLFTAVGQRYLRLRKGSRFLEWKLSPAEGDGPDVRRDRKGYFLDVWNQPYWILYARGEEGRLVLYSFGPNRRRDWDTEEGEPGDDILVPVELPGR